MSEQEAAPAAKIAPPAVTTTQEKGADMHVDVKDPVEAHSEASTPRKRRPPSPSPKAPKEKAVDGEETESEPEKQPKKRAKTSKTPRKTPGRKKKAPEPEPTQHQDLQKEVEDKVAALPDDVKGKFGQVMWAKMGGYPYWPCLITDPRCLPEMLQETALKVLDVKYIVYFYVSNNYAPVLFKMMEPWDDTKFNYREGHPEKESKAPKRRAKLMQAIELADKELKLPITERANGLLNLSLKPQEKTKKVEKPAVESPAPAKRKPGRPLGSKNKKTLEKAAAAAAKKKRQSKGDDAAEKSTGAVKKEKEPAPVNTPEEEEDAAGPALSKDEIKAKVASRKTPKKKGAEDNANSATASAKKTFKTTAKHGKSNGSAHKLTTEIDSKRKKEIELVVPHKTVKSADIREMTEEAAKKKLGGGPKSKTKKDKGDYKVGDLGSFASKMARLHAKESARNNDELVGMMQELFKETLMYRSDVERSGLAAVIAILRKSLSSTVGQTASALRRHMIKILNHDTDIVSSSKKDKSGAHHDSAENASKKRKVENGGVVKAEETSHKSPTEASSNAVENSASTGNSTTKDNASSPSTDGSDAKKADDAPVNDAKAKTEPPSKPSKEEPVETDDAAQKPTTSTDKRPSSPIKVVAKPTDDAAKSTNEVAKSTDDTVKSTDDTEKPTDDTEKPTADAAKDEDDIFQAPEQIDKNREIFVDMLSKVLEHEGSMRADLAKEIETAMFERFKESNDDYLTQARIVIFGLKENAKLRERLFSGNLHTLEVAYADDTFFKTTE